MFFFFQAEDGIRDWSVTGSSDVCSSDLLAQLQTEADAIATQLQTNDYAPELQVELQTLTIQDRKSVV